MLFNIKTLKWDEKICSYLDIPMCMLPEVKPSSSDFGYINILGKDIPLCGVAGDQQAALFGQTCFEEGEAKNTYGTGCFLLMNIGEKFVNSKHGLVTTIAATYNNKIQYALEGSVFVGGAIVQWLRDELRFIEETNDTEYFAKKVKDNNGVYIVPAFTGLGAPYWDMYARGTIFGLTRGTNRNHIIRACLEAIAYQSYDVIEAMKKDTSLQIKSLKVDGGASKNNFLMQFQANIINANVVRAKTMETTALGVAYLAGLHAGVFSSIEQIRKLYDVSQTYYPEMDENVRSNYLSHWKKAVKMCQGWMEE